MIDFYVFSFCSTVGNITNYSVHGFHIKTTDPTKRNNRLPAYLKRVYHMLIEFLSLIYILNKRVQIKRLVAWLENQTFWRTKEKLELFIEFLLDIIDEFWQSLSWFCICVYYALLVLKVNNRYLEFDFMLFLHYLVRVSFFIWKFDQFTK